MSNITRWVSEFSYFSSPRENVDTAITTTILESWFISQSVSSLYTTGAVSLAHCKVVVKRYFQLILDFFKDYKKWIYHYHSIMAWDSERLLRTLWLFKRHTLQLVSSTFEEWVHKHEIEEIFVQCMSSCLLTRMCDLQTLFINSVLRQAA